MNNMNYPPYYKPVFVKYILRGLREEHIDKMWLAVDDNGEYLWTLTKNNQCWTDGLIKIINWWECSTNSENVDSTKKY